MNMVSVICPIYNEEKYIKKCVESILAQDYPKDALEVLFIDGMSTDNTRMILSEYIQKNSYIKLIDNPNRTVPYAMNLGIKSSKGNVIIRIDAHARYETTYFSSLLSALKRTNADNVGGVCKTIPANNYVLAKAIAAALSSCFGMGNSYFRVGAKDEMKVDTVPFGCYKKEVFEKIGLFDEELTRNQDDEFNGRLIKAGGKIFLIPEIVIEYYARDKISKIIKMYYQYGLFKPLVNKKIGSPATIRQFFPMLFVAGLLIGSLVSWFSKVLLFLYIVVLSLYALLSVIFSLKPSLHYKTPTMLFLLPFVFLSIHLSYGIGYWHGILKLLFRKKFSVEINR